MTGERPIRRGDSTSILSCQAVHTLPMRKTMLPGEGMRYRHNPALNLLERRGQAHRERVGGEEEE